MSDMMEQSGAEKIKHIETITKEYLDGVKGVQDEFLTRVGALRKKADALAIDELQKGIKTGNNKRYEQQSDTQQAW